jgi:serine/threonine protein phosphatase PrpC
VDKTAISTCYEGESMKIAYESDIGRRRELDEDSIIVMRSCAAYGPNKRQAAFLVVADGMGGHNSGEIASRLAAAGIAQGMTRIMLRKNRASSADKINPFIQQLVRNINQDLFKFAGKNPHLKGMGTTLTLALVMGLKIHIGHVGDSRAYIVSKDEMRQITRDHSLVQEMVDRGELTPEEARTHPRKNIITRAIGVYKDIDVDVYEEYIFGDDYLLLCCDGLTDMVTDQEIYTVVMSNDDPQQICDILIQKANEKGGRDNISVIVAQFDELPLREEDEEEETEIKRSPEVEEKTHVY